MLETSILSCGIDFFDMSIPFDYRAGNRSTAYTITYFVSRHGLIAGIAR
jgi:hypothetical protein